MNEKLKSLKTMIDGDYKEVTFPIDIMGKQFTVSTERDGRVVIKDFEGKGQTVQIEFVPPGSNESKRRPLYVDDYLVCEPFVNPDDKDDASMLLFLYTFYKGYLDATEGKHPSDVF
jgi:hypothetical protein